MLSLYLIVFLVGAVAGTLVHHAATRLPDELSLLWPGPRCLKCAGPLGWLRLLPLFGPLLRPRCPACREPFFAGRLLAEVGTGLAFCGLFHLEIVRNVLDIPLLARQAPAIQAGDVPGAAWVIFGVHAVLLGFLLAASLCDLRRMEIPLGLTTLGTIVGLIVAVVLPWPWPGAAAELPRPNVLVPFPKPPHGLYPWPVVLDLPDWLPPGSWRLGLATGLAGALAGTLVLRGVRFLFTAGRGIEGLGMGDADLMMMAGAFVGWQVVLLAFFVAVFPALLLGIVQLLFRGGEAMPFGPPLALGVLLTLWSWPRIGEHFRPLFQNPEFLLLLAVVGAVFLFVAALLLRLLRGRPAEEQA
jgi:leader peptidase (prepilin peptidase)/N-methyltransferase